MFYHCYMMGRVYLLLVLLPWQIVSNPLVEMEREKFQIIYEIFLQVFCCSFLSQTNKYKQTVDTKTWPLAKRGSGYQSPIPPPPPPHGYTVKKCEWRFGVESKELTLYHLGSSCLHVSTMYLWCWTHLSLKWVYIWLDFLRLTYTPNDYLHFCLKVFCYYSHYS